jgi:hypothetical protein
LLAHTVIVLTIAAVCTSFVTNATLAKYRAAASGTSSAVQVAKWGPDYNGNAASNPSPSAPFLINKTIFYKTTATSTSYTWTAKLGDNNTTGEGINIRNSGSEVSARATLTPTVTGQTCSVTLNPTSPYTMSIGQASQLVHVTFGKPTTWGYSKVSFPLHFDQID